MSRNLWALTVFAIALPALAAEPDWQPVATELLKSEKTGFGGLTGILVDHQSGRLYAWLSDRGLFVSEDRGGSWKRASDKQPKGRTEWPGCLMLDPVGKSGTLVTALVYGAPISVSTDSGATWKSLDAKSSHIDWCAVDWSDADMKFILALKHESGDLLIASHDGGKTFADIGKGYGPAWIFDEKTAVIAEAKTKAKPKPGLLRTTDGGKTFEPCGDYSARALPKWHDGKLYWLTDAALIATADKGKTWKKLGDVKDGQHGPIFGKEASHLFVLTRGGVAESHDGGVTWSKPIAPPKALQGISTLTWLNYDPNHDTLYLMKMGGDLYRLERGK